MWVLELIPLCMALGALVTGCLLPLVATRRGLYVALFNPQSRPRNQF